MRVLVTGATGFVGHAATAALHAAGHDTAAVTREDLADPSRLDDALTGADAVIHLAALARVRDSHRHPIEYFTVNTGLTLSLLAALDRRHQQAGPVPRLVFTSTAAVYGTPAEQPIPETAPLAPTSPYGASKAAAEAAITWQARTGRLAAVTLRCFNIAGAAGGRGDSDPTRIIPAVLRAAATGEALRVNGDGSALRDYVHVLDVADALVLALGAAGAGEHLVFNLGGERASVAQIIAAAEQVTGRGIPVIRGPAADEPPLLAADSGLARAGMGWRSFRSTLPQVIADAWGAEPHMTNSH